MGGPRIHPCHLLPATQRKDKALGARGVGTHDGDVSSSQKEIGCRKRSSHLCPFRHIREEIKKIKQNSMAELHTFGRKPWGSTQLVVIAHMIRSCGAEHDDVGSMAVAAAVVLISGGEKRATQKT